MSREAMDRVETAYREAKDDVYSVAFHLLGDRGRAEDVLQDVFCAFARRAETLRLDGSARAYLVACAANRARDVLRRRRIEPEVREDFPGRAESGDGPAEAAAKRDEAAFVSTLLGALPAEQREVLVLRHHGRLTFPEIAGQLGISVNTAQSRHRYALGKLRARLTAREGVA